MNDKPISAEFFTNTTVNISDYKFEQFKKIFVANTPKEIDSQCYCQGEIWQWPCRGRMISLNWQALNISSSLKEILKSYIFSRLQTKSAYTITCGDLTFVHYINKNSILHNITWTKNKVIQALKKIDHRQIYYSLKLFYKWCLDQNFDGFNSENYKIICNTKPIKAYPFKNIYLRQNYIQESQIKSITKKLEEPLNENISLKKLQLRVLLRLCIELAPRPSQTYALNKNDLLFFENGEKKFYALNLPMVKKKNQKNNGFRTRAITSKLAFEIELLIKKNQTSFSEANALFTNKNGYRISCDRIIKVINRSNTYGLSSGNFRHYLAQSIADQGGSIEVIADILGHNSTYSARAYVASTPKISSIKAHALGKNKTYNKLMKMLETGEITNKSSEKEEEYVKGVVGKQYIGEIGSCGSNTCSKNPIYSCYNCSKFHPFVDGEHDKVLIGLEQNVELFYNIGYSKNDVKNNRSIIQLQETIFAVKKVITFINKENENIL